MVAALCAWHEHHSRAVAEIGRRLARAERQFVAASGLVEAYAVLTRLPPPYRISPGEALALLDANFMRAARIVTLDGRAYQALLRAAPEYRIAGGRTYDGVIAACALKARVTTLLTFNADDFLPFRRKGLEIVVPGEA